MSVLNSILGQVSGDATVQNLAAKVGMSPEQVEQAVAALGQAHGEEGDTVTTASQATGVPSDKLSEIVQHIGGEGALGRFASLLQAEGGASSLLGGLKSFV
jgi:ATP phosphoribosyltransferase regulatory subunit HisZ